MKVLSFDSLLSGALGKKDVILTIGVFDGFHLGHQSLVDEMMRLKEEHPSSETVLITFNTNPKTKTAKNIDTMRLREENAEKKGVDSFVIIDFSSDFSKISACGFIRMLSSVMNPVAVVVGEDFRFGNPRFSASAYDLKSLFSSCGKNVEVSIMQSILTEGGEKISSTLVRRVIEKGDVECISSLTGRNYTVDLMPIPHRSDDGVPVMCSSSFHQLLPPPGAYEAGLTFSSGRTIRVEADLTGSSLRLVSEGCDIESLVSVEGHMEKIYFLEKKENGIK